MQRTLAALFLLLAAGCASRPRAYDRRDWGYGQGSPGECNRVRAEVLKTRSKVPVTMRPGDCAVDTGEWDDYYYPEVHKYASKVEIDHLVPLKHAFDTGGASWSPEQKRAFGTDPGNLVITAKRYNRIKGAKTPLEWSPINHDYACKYLRDWLTIKDRYRLTIAPEERTAVSDCP